MRYFIFVIGFLLVLAGNVRAIDVWDADGAGDSTAATTNNILTHIAHAQLHDLGNLPGPASDQDWYRTFPRAYRSYEVDVFNVTDSARFDSPSGGVSNALTRRDASGNWLQDSVPSDPSGKTRKVKWWNTVNTEERILVTNGYTDNSANTQYSIKLYDTTLSCPRFNNAGTQVSVLILQNVTTGSCDVNVKFFNEAGTLLANQTATIAGNATLVLPAASVPNVSGQKGSVQIGHECGARFMGKLVALEPATGFSFDTICETR